MAVYRTQPMDGYLGYSSYGSRQCNKVEKFKNSSSLVGWHLTTMDAILYLYKTITICFTNIIYQYINTFITQ